MVKTEVEALKSKINELYQDQNMMGVWAYGARSRTRSSELRRPGCVMKRYFERLSKKLDAMSSNQEKRHKKMCTRFEALEQKHVPTGFRFKSLKEKLKTMGDDLAAVKVQVENKSKRLRLRILKRRLMNYKIGHVETTWCLESVPMQRAVKVVCLYARSFGRAHEVP